MHKKSLSIIGAAALIILFLVGALPAIAQAQPEGTPYTECISDTKYWLILNSYTAAYQLLARQINIAINLDLCYSRVHGKS